MSDINSNLSDNFYDNEDYYPDAVIPGTVRMILLIAFIIPSLLCYLFVIVCTLVKKSLRSAPNNYVMLFMLFTSLLVVGTDIPWAIYCYHQYTVLIKSPMFCLVWWFIDAFGLYTSQVLTAWATLERHILIFHSHFYNRKRVMICCHYLAPIVLLLYMLIFYIYVIFLLPCETRWQLDGNLCYEPCYFSDYVFGLWETILHGMITTIFIIIFSSLLIIRVCRSRRRLQQSVHWGKYRRMFFQLISISALYLSINFPICIVYIFHYTSDLSWTYASIQVLSFLNYFIPLLLPFVCLTSRGGIVISIKQILKRQKNRRVDIHS
ncbi:unnamed protein product [Adineta ricciae]|uniref:G-protein coupled receptors family 1 profile domain-containing protein n=1 Tax=Adineta ricciae TaxID=249248 RepID=A0A814R2Y2_ADIRI|nr:unnamed protein product [Adineta ricciae]CAF1478961.1 unnamed protein product [Adineta ricciae]